MRKLILVMGLILTACAKNQSDVSAAGGIGDGGGDPDASTFISYAKKLSVWLSKHPEAVSPSDAGRIGATVNRISRAMDGGTKAPVSFTEGELTDDFGTSKVAIFHEHPFSIMVNRSRWGYLNMVAKYKLVALEIFGLAGLGNRYVQASLVDANFNDIAGGYEYSRYELSLLSSPIFNEMRSYDRHFPETMLFAGRGKGPENEVISGTALMAFELQELSDFQRSVNSFHALPEQLRADIVLGGVATYSDPLFPNGWGWNICPNFPLPNEQLAGHLRDYIWQIEDMIKYYLSKNAHPKPSAAEAGKLKEFYTRIDKLFKTVDASYVVGHTTYVNFKTPYTPYFTALIQHLRKVAIHKGCEIPTTFELSEYKDVLEKRLEEAKDSPDLDLAQLAKEGQSGVQALGDDLKKVGKEWQQFATKANLDRIGFYYTPPDHFATDTYYLIKIAGRYVEAVDQNYREGRKFLSQIQDGLDSGALCAQF